MRQARGQPWSINERQVCWAAGLWIRAYNRVQATALSGVDLLFGVSFRWRHDDSWRP
jgi:hypothetical protein